MEENDILDDDNFDITEHIVKKENTNWEEKWKHPNTYTIYKMPECHLENIPVLKSNEPWYRRFENNKRKRRK